MKFRFIPVLFLFILPICFTNAQSDFYSKRWSRVYRYEVKELPKSALAVADTIYASAKRDKNIPQLIKAIIFQSKFAQTLEEDATLSIVKKFENEISTSEPPLKNILESLLANIYWEYFKENRYKLYGRTHTQNKINKEDFRTWDAEAMFQEIHKHFQNSLQNGATIQKIKLSTIDDILTQAENSKLYRPTIYDFLANNALEFYRTGESLITKPVNSFALNDPRYFDQFETMTLVSSDSLSPLVQALQIFKDLLAFHQREKDTTIYVNLERERLLFLVDQGTFENKSSLYKKGLARLRSEYAHHPVSTLIDFDLASLLYEEGEKYKPKTNTENQFSKSEALKVCEQAINNFNNSEGANKCSRLEEKILNEDLEITAEACLPIDVNSRIFINYANIDSLIFSIIPISAEYEKTFKELPISFREEILRKSTPLHHWLVVLPDLQDHQSHTTEIVIPKLKQGKYILFASLPKNPTNIYSSQIYAHTTIQITNLVLLETDQENEDRFQVVDRNNGKPIVNADIHFTNAGRETYTKPMDHHFKTDQDGFVTIKKTYKESFSNLKATITHQKDTAVYERYIINEQNNDNEEVGLTAKCFLFSDRSIYRPGQTVFFKGILVKTKSNKSSLVPGQFVEVVLEDVNGNKVGSMRLKTNTFGSFSGEFKLPTTGLTGRYRLNADEDGDEGSTFYDDLDSFYSEDLHINVEEYKRPTFETFFKPVIETFRLNETVTLKGLANTYSGAKVSGAKIKYHVKRNVRYPNWYYWHHPRNYTPEKEISYGEVSTNDDGEFSISFQAIPDEKVSKNEKPVFSYEVTADVTDINGETRSATTTIKAGYHSLEATLTAPGLINRKKSKENVISITTQNLNDQFVPVKGTIQIFKLKGPSAPLRPRPWTAPDLYMIAESEFKNLFPHEAYNDESDVNNWHPGKLMFNTPFNTALSKEAKFKTDHKWETGSYLIELKTIDPSGEIITDKTRFNVTEEGIVPDNQLLVFETDKSAYLSGESVHLKIGSASPDITLMIDIEKDHKITKTYVEHFSNNTKEIVLATDGIQDGFAIHCTAVNFNTFLKEKKTIPVIVQQRKIKIETITFRDKLQPGTQDTWSFMIKGDEDEKIEAEVLASMYDASLDQFKTHAWAFNPIELHYYYSYLDITADNCFDDASFVVTNLPQYGWAATPAKYYDKFDWFGFSLSGNTYLHRRYMDRLYYTTSDKPSIVTMANSKKIEKGYITGRVVDRNGDPVAGVNVLVKGTTTGTVTDADGNYALEANKDDVLVYSFIGYATAEATVGWKNTINVLMEEDATELAEIIVTGYGELKKSMLTGAIANVISMPFNPNDREYEFTSSSLQGKTSGVQITGIPGSDGYLVIRGGATLRNAEPLYVVDGVVVGSSKIEKIDKGDVENIEVLKGDAATAIYGARASNGAIIVTTKSGQKKLDEEMAKLTVRKNFNETAFFFPHLKTDETGTVQFTFSSPESLTRWKLQLLAHTKDLASTIKTLEAVTQKELMVTPNMPRFLRDGDEVILGVKISNLTSKTKEGKVALQLTNAITGESVDEVFKNIVKNQSFKINGKANTEVFWKLKVPSGFDAVQYKLVAKAGNFSDGEQNVLPVLSNRILVTETLPMYVRSGETKTFSLTKLKTTNSTTLRNHQLTLEVTANPAWYAILSLPYLMEFPYECAEQTFSRYYANTLASHIINSNANIKNVFDKWGNNALLSNLEKNQDLKSIILSETPWVRDAENETEQRKRIALLFDLKTLKEKNSAIIDKLAKLQLSDGGFTWFIGGDHASRYITQHIASSFGHLKQLRVIDNNNEATAIIHKAVGFLDQQIKDDYNELLKQANDIRYSVKDVKEGESLAKEYMAKQHVYNNQIHYLYMRSFFTDVKLDDNMVQAINYYREQSGEFWHEFNLYFKGMIALTHFRNKNILVAKDILKSLKETSIISDELGMYWKENNAGWYWYQAPVETHALLIEAFTEIEAKDNTLTDEEKTKTIDELRIWLVKNKQTSQWKTTKATTEAIYALLLNGSQWLPVEDQLDVYVDNKSIVSDKDQQEAGTGYFKTSWKGDDIKPGMSDIRLTKKDKGISWAGLYWQYFEDLDKITPAETPLKLHKKVFVVNRNDKGEFLVEAGDNTHLKVGDLIRVRIELKSDRAMEFLHMKDMRASGLEPVDVLSKYKWQDGLGYYQSTKDASTNFFFDRIQPGVYVFEYDLRVNNKGNFSNGITTIQSMYAPEFSSHSEGIRVIVE